MVSWSNWNSWFRNKSNVSIKLEKQIIYLIFFKSYHFICQKWLATDEDDKMISREIPAIESRGNRSGAPLENISESSLDYGLEMQSKFYRK